jgi:hypothetical protein
MSLSLQKKLLFTAFFFVMVFVPVSGQGIYVDLNSIPKAGTALIYAHQDDDLIWMLPFWKITEKFIGGAMPPTPRSRTIIHQQQVYMDNHECGIDYEHNWVTPWGDITDEEYNQYYWIANPDYNYLLTDHLETRLGPDLTPLSIIEINKLKAKIEKYIASPSVTRIITHNIWGEYGHAHHLAVNKAVRELAVKYRKDVWMLGSDNGNFINVEIPSGITYTTARFDSVLHAEIRAIYETNYYWTSDDYVPANDCNFIKIVESGIDRSNVFTGETVTVPGSYQKEPGAYIFDGVDDYLTLNGDKNTSFTISMRIRPDVIKAMDISKMSEYPSSLTCDRSFYLQANGQLTARIFDGQAKTVTSTRMLTSGTWANIVMTGDGSNLKIYINGIFEGSIAAGTPAQYLTPEFVLGQAQETSSFFKGQISDVRFFDHALTDSEITAMAHWLTISGVTAHNKVYDGTIEAVINKESPILSGVDASDDVTLVSADASGQFENKNVGISKKVLTSGFSLTGADAASYTLSQPITTADILIAPLTVSGVAVNDKVYDGTTTASLKTALATLAGVVDGDIVTLSSVGATGTFETKTAGINKSVSTSGFALGGADAVKYTVTQPAVMGTILPKPLTIIGLTANNKVYDGNKVATLSGIPALSGVVIPDVVIPGGTPVATFASSAVADNIPVSVTGFTISGASSGNYSLTQPLGLKANITLITDIEDIKSGKIPYSVYPNPASDFVTLDIVDYENEKLSYILIDSRGNILENKQITSSRTVIPIQNLFSGTYFIRITDNKNGLKTIKIIKH